MVTTAIAPRDATSMELAAVVGDLSKLSSDERVQYYAAVCESMGLNPLSKPFDYIVLNGKLTLYCRKDATDQLRKLHRVNVQITDRQTMGDVHIVTARATTPEGRQDEEIGAVSIGNLKGDALANALMKATTKAKRRVTLSICGLGWLDETELETIKDARPAPAYVETASHVVVQKTGEIVGTIVTTPNARPPVAIVEPDEPSEYADLPDDDDVPAAALPENVDILRRLIASMSKDTYHSTSVPLIQSDEVGLDAVAQIQNYAGSVRKALGVVSIIIGREVKNWGNLSHAEGSALVYWSRPGNAIKAKADVDAILAARWEGD